MSCWKDKYYSISCLYARQTLIVVDVSNCRNYQARNTSSSKIFEWLHGFNQKYFVPVSKWGDCTNLRAEPHTAALHDTIMCKFWSMSRDMSFQPGHFAWLFPEYFATDPAAGIGDSVPGLLADNMRGLKIGFIRYCVRKFQSANTERERESHQNSIRLIAFS